MIRLIALGLILSHVNLAGAQSPTPISGPFGSKPIQLSIGAGGITQRKEPGWNCDIDTTIGGGHYSDWGQIEKDAREIVLQECNKKSGMLICKKEKITCKQEK
jgi:hypothetical protein